MKECKSCSRLAEMQDKINDGKIAADVYAELRARGYDHKFSREVIKILGSVVRERIGKLIYF